MMFKTDLCKYSSHPTTSASKPSIKICVSKIQNVWPWQDLNLHLMPDGTRTRNIQIRGLMHYPLCDELLYQLSYMAGESSLAEESTTHTTLQHALQIKSCPSLKCLCKESRCYAHLHNCKYVFSASLIGVLVWSVSYEISHHYSIGGLI